jgi:hypothetical protein
MIVAVFDQQPIVALASHAVMLHPHQHPAAVKPVAFQRELQIALRKGLLRRL